MTQLSETIQLALDLLARPSVTPDDFGCQDLMTKRLADIGFKIVEVNKNGVTNFLAFRGNTAPTIGFAGHTDVVPTGGDELWKTPPFEPTIDGDLIYARGAADMKGSLAAMVTACERFVAKHPKHDGRIAFLITSDEEGPSTDGTIRLVEYLKEKEEELTYCIVGEPSSTNKLGDIIKNGRRGSINATLTVHGTAGHVAYPHLADNPIHHIGNVINALTAEQWDKGNEYFPATTFQISNINGGTGATNVIPPSVEIVFNLRFSSEITDKEIMARVAQILDSTQLNYDIEWKLSGHPFITPKGELVNAVSNAIESTCGYETTLSTTGGTSDGRFIATLGTQVVELGPLNATIHQIDECVSIKDLDNLSIIYERTLENLLTPNT